MRKVPRLSATCECPDSVYRAEQEPTPICLASRWLVSQYLQPNQTEPGEYAVLNPVKNHVYTVHIVDDDGGPTWWCKHKMCALTAELLGMGIETIAFVLPGQELGDDVVRMSLGGGVEIVVKSLEEKEKEGNGQS